MLPLLPLTPTTHLFLAVLALGAASALLLARELFRRRAARALLGVAYAIPAVGLALWDAGREPWAGLGVRLAWTALVVLAPASALLFVAALLFRGLTALAALRRARTADRARLADRARPAAQAAPAPDGSRRALIQASLSFLPATAAAASLRGLAAAPDEPRVPLVRMRFRGLHPDLVGLKILQLSDLHLGVSKGVEHLEATLARVAPLAPDLIVLTGDVADDHGQLRAALDAVHRHRPRLGVFACLGNHEYLHDIRRTRPLYEQSPVPLLVDRGTTVAVGRARLYIAGADDPVVLGGEELRSALERSVARCREGAPEEDAFRLLLCHRPEGFPFAARRGFHLTLAGHTHGGQIGLFGRSALQSIWPDEYLWGTYARGESRLYTTSGFGHWFPFRLGCPTEAPLLVLERA
ncbi:metallophosphoesterase [Sorangium sp. So ce1182]|uniref:metallophosphoesterase n=1 Tax=Sorangium sp. So ce1182 TaxID=3133334 RepID=UPI003F5DE770